MSRIPAAVALTVVQRDGNTCQYCGAPLVGTAWVFEHIIPEAQGGPSTVYNLVQACRPCNTRKSRSVWLPVHLNTITADYPEWRARIIRNIGNWARTSEEGWAIVGTEWWHRFYDRLLDYAQEQHYPFRDMLRDAISIYLEAEGLLASPPDSMLESATHLVQAARKVRPHRAASRDEDAAALTQARALRAELDSLVAELDQAEQAA